MVNLSQKIKGLGLIRLLLIFLSLILISCKNRELKITPCAVIPGDTLLCHAVPLNQPEVRSYDRILEAGDICLSAKDYAEVQKAIRALYIQCGDSCR